MATRLITNDAQLRRYMPNVFATAQGETPLYDKVLPWLETAERWLFSQFVEGVSKFWHTLFVGYGLFFA